ncbi:MAG: Acyl dehydratase [Chloroflexi bacterium]|jgi:hypothetical protein|nr:MAG: Acyl dehydratase [Chloroflexota bacterium]|tara:strand:+ start:2221 stop:3081 length:861 start_codon:yes stop_codon:yes gene_type:complete
MTQNKIEIPAVNKIPKTATSTSITWKDLNVGPFPNQCTMTISLEDIKRWCSLYDDDVSLYKDFAPHYIGYYCGQNIFTPFRDIAAGLVYLNVEFFKDIPHSVPLTVTGKVIEKSTRKGRGYVDWITEIKDQDTIVQRNTRSWYFASLTEEEIKKFPLKKSGISIPEKNINNISSKLKILLNQERMNQFEGPGEINGHTNVDLAKKQGNPGPLAQGAFGFGLISRLLAKDYGARFTNGGQLSLKFVRPVWAGEEITASYSYDNKQSIRVSVEKDNKEEVIVGSAKLA